MQLDAYDSSHFTPVHVLRRKLLATRVTGGVPQLQQAALAAVLNNCLSGVHQSFEEVFLILQDGQKD